MVVGEVTPGFYQAYGVDFVTLPGGRRGPETDEEDFEVASRDTKIWHNIVPFLNGVSQERREAIVREYGKTVALREASERERQLDLDAFIRRLDAYLESLPVEQLSVTPRRGIYRTLTGPKDIRILELAPGLPGAPLTGDLRHASLEFDIPWEKKSWHGSGASQRVFTDNFAVFRDVRKAHRYTALSYVWGDPKYSRQIEIEGMAIAITETLYSALQHLRHPEHSVLLWVDQVCIDQEDFADKEAQVLLMGEIYSRAWTTAIWVGHEGDEGALTALRILSDSTMGQVEFTEEDIYRLKQPDARWEAGGSFAKLEGFLNRPWFSRTWVIQEAALSKRAYILTGSSHISWSDFTGYCFNLAGTPIFRRIPGDLAQDGLSKVSGLEAAREIGSIGISLATQQLQGGLLHILCSTRYARVSNPLDRVYGVLSLCENTIRPDYTLSASDMVINVARALLKEDRGQKVFMILSCIDHPPTDAIPSWVVDWTQPRVTSAIGYHTSSFNCFDAGAMATSKPDTWLFSLEDNRMHLKGKPFSRIVQLSDVIKHTELLLDPEELSASGLRTCIEFVLPYIGNAKGTFATFAKLIVAGKDDTGKQKSPPEYEQIVSLLCDTISGKKPTFPDQTYSKRHQQGHFTLEHLRRRSLGRHFQHFRKAFSAAVTNRKLCWTYSGHLALVPRYSEVGDEIWVFPYSAVPFVLRPTTSGEYHMIGECYCHEIMDGKVVHDDSTELRDVVLV